MGLPELISTVRCESYSSLKVKSLDTFIKRRTVPTWRGRSYPPPDLRDLNRVCQVTESGRVGASFVFLEPLAFSSSVPIFMQIDCILP